ncbi:hypothetical protein BGX29_002238 [Mortierella sp. GBA35]|nr:hypothetical protein BGX29_002238 [Mortierella sp. GBA35]
MSPVAPSYSGAIKTFDNLEGLSLHSYFTSTPIASWSAANFLTKHPIIEQPDFLRGLKAIAKRNVIHAHIRAFCHVLDRYYDSIQGQDDLRLLKAQRISADKKRVIQENDYVQKQEHIINTQDQATTTTIHALGRSDSFDKETKQEAVGKLATTSNVDAETFQELNQQSDWTEDSVDILALFQQFAEGREDLEQDVASDGIADLTSTGTFLKTLKPNIRRSILSSVVEPPLEPELETVMDASFDTGTASKSFSDLHVELHETKSTPFARYLTEVMASYERFYKYPRSPMEREYTAKLILPVLEGALDFYGLPMRTFEIPLYGCQIRKNSGKSALDPTVLGHKADGVVEIDGDQIMILEVSRMASAGPNKLLKDRYKLLRDMRDSWIHLLRTKLSQGREPGPLKMFGIQVFEQDISFFVMDVVGCFRVMEVLSATVPGSNADSVTDMALFIKVALSFAKMIREEVYRVRSWPRLGTSRRLEMQCYLDNIAATSTSPKSSNKRRRQTSEQHSRHD